MELHTTKNIVFNLLKENEVLRDDDDLLILNVYKKLGITENVTFCGILRSRKNLGLPSFEAIRRTRAKIQAEFPELKGSERIQRERELQEYKYRELARE